MSWTDGDDRVEVELKRSPKSWAEVELPAAQKTIREQAAEIDRLRETARTLAAQSQEKEREIISRDNQIFELETELDRLRALLRRWVDASVWNMTELERETRKALE